MYTSQMYDSFVGIYINNNYPEGMTKLEAFTWELHLMGLDLEPDQVEVLANNMLEECGGVYETPL